jgi:hypothetical protein
MDYNLLPNENLIAPCGLYCGECLAFQDRRCGGCVSRKGLCLKYSEICNIYDCCVTGKGHRFCAECEKFPCGRIDKFFTIPEWHEEVMNNLGRIKAAGVKQFLSEQVSRVTELINCAEGKGIKHCSQCEDWPCERLKRPALVPD